MSAQFITLAFSAGLLSLLTPCVFPMIPLTASYFGTGTDSKSSRMRSALVFAAAIILTFATLGAGVAIGFGATGINRFAANPWFNLGMAGFLALFGVNMLGFFHLALPSSVLTRLSTSTSKARVDRTSGAFLLGAVFAFTSFSCTAPLVGTLLVTASSGDVIVPLVGMIVYATAFSIPLVVVAVTPLLLRTMPKPGAWLGTLKVFSGLVELGMALRYAANADAVWTLGVFDRSRLLLCFALLAVIGAANITGFVRFPQDIQRFQRTPTRLAFAFTMLLVSGWMLRGASGAGVGELEAYMPAQRQPDTTSASTRWIVNDLESAVAQSRASQRPIFIDFTGYTCTNCRWMEANVFTEPEVRAELSRFVLVRLFTDGDGDLYTRQQDFQRDNFGTVALPLYAVITPDTSIVATTAGLTRDPAAFASFLRKAVERRTR